MFKRILLFTLLTCLVAGCGGSAKKERYLGSWLKIATIDYPGNGNPGSGGGKEKPQEGKAKFELLPGGLRLRIVSDEKGVKSVDLGTYTKSGLAIMFPTAGDMLTGAVRFRNDESEMAIFKDGFEIVYQRQVPVNKLHRLWVAPSAEAPEALLVLGDQGVFALRSKKESTWGTYEATDANITWKDRGKKAAAQSDFTPTELKQGDWTFVPLEAPDADFGSKLLKDLK